MNKLQKILVAAVSLLSLTVIPVACTEEDETKTETPLVNFNVKGKNFVSSYFNSENGEHDAGTDLLEFKSDSVVIHHNWFCILIGDYLQLLDTEVEGRYTVNGNTVLLAWEDKLEVASVIAEADNVALRIGKESFQYSQLSVAAHSNRFKTLHAHDLLDPVVKPADSLVTVAPGDRFLVELDRRSFILTIDSVAGSNAYNDQNVTFRISDTPGDFKMSESAGSIYLMRFGSMGYAPVDKEMAESNPNDVVFSLVTNNAAANYTLAAPSVDKTIKGSANHTKFVRLKPLLY